MPTTHGNPPKFNVGNYNGQHIKNLSARAKKVERLYLQAVRKMARAAQPTLSAGDAGQEFHWKDFPALGKEINALARDLTDNLQLNIEAGDKEAWALSNTKNDAMVDAMAGKSGISKATLRTWKAANLAAMNAFIGRKEAGMGLSGRVWKLGEQFKAEMELALETCIGKGMSAAEISREIRQYLQYPDKLFRRVRDEKGVLRLSKAAQAFHPGAGVYRSSYKNALRMTATETNMAYRTADHGRWNALPFVLGQMISTSNNHPVEDICDELAGRYPKEFKFTGWHPWCRCYAVAILADQKEMDEYTKALMDGEDVDGWHFTGEVTDMPECWTRWVKANRGRIANAKSQPYFIRDNQKAVDKILKGKEGGKAKTPLTPEQRVRRDEIKKQAKKLLHGVEMRNEGFDKPITISNTAIKEWLNQPFAEYMEKNEALLTLPKLIKEAEYLGYGADKHDPSIKAHFFQTTKIGGANAWIIVREMEERCSVYSISDNVSIIGHIAKRRE